MRAWIHTEDFLDSGSEENIVDSGEEFVPVHLEADSSDSDNNIFIFIIGIHAVATEKGIWYDSMDYLSDKYTSQAF